MIYSKQNQSIFSSSLNVLVLLTLFAFLGCGTTQVDDQTKQADTNLLTKELKATWADAKIGTDSKYQKSFPAEAKLKAIAPEDMRSSDHFIDWESLDPRLAAGTKLFLPRQTSRCHVVSRNSQSV